MIAIQASYRFIRFVLKYMQTAGVNYYTGRNCEKYMDAIKNEPLAAKSRSALEDLKCGFLFRHAGKIIHTV